jgi:hypothetical protein
MGERRKLVRVHAFIDEADTMHCWAADKALDGLYHQYFRLATVKLLLRILRHLRRRRKVLLFWEWKP